MAPVIRVMRGASGLRTACIILEPCLIACPPAQAGVPTIAGGVGTSTGRFALVFGAAGVGGMCFGEVDRAVVADDAAGQAKDIRLQANGGGAVARR